MIENTALIVATVSLPLPENPSTWAREQLALGWDQVLVFVTASVGILSVFFLIRVITRG